MRKQTKLVAVLSTAALLAIGASMTSFAAQGWAEEDGTWVYYDRNGDRVTEEWKKSGDNWYWLNDDGEMAVDELIEDDDDYFYVDANGAMVRNQWVAIENEDAGDEDEPDHYWYYFQTNGKAFKRSDSATTISAKVINGKKYAFDEEGRMLYGWVTADGERQTGDDAWKANDDEDVYYMGGEDDGAMRVNTWELISIVDDDNADSLQPGDEYWDEEQDRWFWFQSSGKRKQAGPSKDFVDKSINGKKYGFDTYGRMVASWYADTASLSEAAGKSTDSQGQKAYSEQFMYFSSPEDGARFTKGWFKVVPGYYLHESKYEDGDEYWYYANGDGQIYANKIKKIKGKKYAFDSYGRMINGLAFLEFANGDETEDIVAKHADDEGGDGTTQNSIGVTTLGNYDTEDNFKDWVRENVDAINEGTLRSYYFGSSDDGAMKTGKQTVSIDGENFAFEFNKNGNLKGAGAVGFDDDKIYLAGMQLKADKDDKYEVVKVDLTVRTGSDKKEHLVQSVTEMTTKQFLDECMKKSSKSDEDDTVWEWDTSKADKNPTTSIEAVDVKDVKKADGEKMTYYFLLNSSGKVSKNKSGAKDGDDYKFSVNKYQITEVSLEN